MKTSKNQCNASILPHGFFLIVLFVAMSLVACGGNSNNSSQADGGNGDGDGDGDDPVNRSIQVDAGTDLVLTLPFNSIQLNPRVTVDGSHESLTLTYAWTKQSGEGTVIFDDERAEKPVITFENAGIYVFELSVSDNELTGSDTVQITVYSESSTNEWGAAFPRAINSVDNPGSVNVHYNSGGRRFVRVNNTIVAICPHGSGEYTYRSSDEGETWELIDTDGAFSGCLITGPNDMVYHFFRNGRNVYMVRFRYDESTIPSPLLIYNAPEGYAPGHGAYNMINATIDKDGSLYVATHWDDQISGGGDTLYLIRSVDGGDAWPASGEALTVAQGSPEHSWGFIHLEVNQDNVLVAVYSEWGSLSLQFAKSIDGGNVWDTFQLGSGNIYNPSVLTVGTDTIYVFAQASVNTSLRGLVFNQSDDLGTTWNGWIAIDDASLSGYADPSPGLGSDGTIYVAYRSGARPDLSGTYGGDGCRQRLAMSNDGGTTWLFPDDYFYDENGNPTERTGCRSQIRYQTWWNYGGPLEWIWMQYENNGTNRPIYYDYNKNAQIYNQLSN